MGEWHQVEVPGNTRFGDVRHFGEIDSTNTALVAMAKEGAPDGTVLVADHQLAGKGRLGRAWQAPPGASLLVSVLIRPSLRPEQAHLFTIAAALAASDSCEALGGVRPDLKWPNDLVIESNNGTRKLAGLLAESVITGAKLHALVIGMGLNVCWPDELPDDLVDIAVALNHLNNNVSIDRLELLIDWLGRLDENYNRLDAKAPKRVTELLARYRDRCCTLGRDVRVEMADREVVGRALDITDLGHLIVESDKDLVEVSVGDVIHLRATS